MDRYQQKEKGAIMILAAVSFVALIGIAALALDVGRLLNLNTEMHNAADAAALAAAYELNGSSGAMGRAEAVAKNLLTHKGRFGRDDELLKESLPVSNITFYCAIGSEYDLAAESACTGTEESPNHYLATGDSDAHYVKVELNNQESYTVDLFFLPVLKAFPSYLTDVADEATGYAAATAGRHYIICNYPPLMICDPFEGSGGFKNTMQVGHQIQLKVQGGGGWWAPGDFGFLKAHCSGAKCLANYIADPNLTGCTPAIVTTEPGGNTGPTTWAINTYFDEYDKPSKYNWPDYPPAPNVINYPQDEHFTNRIGDGDWERDDYWDHYHEAAKPAGYDDMTRWQVYNWEIENNKLPCYEGYEFRDKHGHKTGDELDCNQPNPSDDFPDDAIEDGPTLDGKPDPTHLNSGDYPPPQSRPERRLLYIATLSCEALEVKGRIEVPVNSPDGFAKIFITEHTLGPPDADLTGEYVGWADNKEANYHVDIQLYE